MHYGINSVLRTFLLHFKRINIGKLSNYSFTYVRCSSNSYLNMELVNFCLGFLSYILAHAREIFHSFKMNDDNFCSSCSSIFLTRVQKWIIIYNLLGLLSHIFDRAEILTAEHILQMIDRSSFKIPKHTGKL